MQQEVANFDIALSKSKLAEVLGVDRAQPGRWVKKGCPTTEDGKIPFSQALDWANRHLDPFCRAGKHGKYKLEPDVDFMTMSLTAEGAARLLFEAAPLVALAVALAGGSRQTAQRAGSLALAMLSEKIDEMLDGGEAIYSGELLAWPERVRWGSLFDKAGESVCRQSDDKSKTN